MKTRRDIFGGLMLAAAALVCLTGCKKDDEGEKVVLGADFEQTAGMQKTYIGNGDKTIYWNVGDEVNINGTACEVHDGAVEVVLNKDGYAAVYPATGDNSLTYNGEVSGKNCTGGSVVIPATQEYLIDENTGVQKLNAPMAARLDSKTGRLLFRNLYAVIKVTVQAKSDADFTLSSITVESTENIAGTETFNFVQSEKTGKTDSVNITELTEGTVSKSVTLTNINSIIPANNSASFYLYLLPYTPKDITIKLNGNRKDSKDRTSFTDKVERSRLGYTTVNVNALTVLFSGIGRFKVGDNKYVTFAPGNLQYQASSTTWRFAEHQWDYIGKAAGNTTTMDNGRATQSAWIDLFGWGTSGYDKKYPYMTSQTNEDYGNGNSNIAGTYYDWGVYNAIYNPQTGLTDPKGTWRTLTKDEWTYLLGTGTGTRTTTHSDWWIYNMVKIKEADGTNNVSGLIIYPDGVTAKPEGVTADLTQNNNTAVVITKADFGKLEAMGCVFLPAACYRIRTSVYTGSLGYYWSSTYGSSDYACYLHFYSGAVSPSYYYNRCYGLSVRLVKNVK